MRYRIKRAMDLLSPLRISIQVYHTSKISFLHLAFPGLFCNQYGPIIHKANSAFSFFVAITSRVIGITIYPWLSLVLLS